MLLPISGNSTTRHTATPTTYSATLSKPEIDITDALAKPTIKLNNIALYVVGVAVCIVVELPDIS